MMESPGTFKRVISGVFIRSGRINHNSASTVVHAHGGDSEIRLCFAGGVYSRPCIQINSVDVNGLFIEVSCILFCQRIGL